MTEDAQRLYPNIWFDSKSVYFSDATKTVQQVNNRKQPPFNLIRSKSRKRVFVLHISLHLSKELTPNTLARNQGKPVSSVGDVSLEA